MGTTTPRWLGAAARRHRTKGSPVRTILIVLLILVVVFLALRFFGRR